MKKRYFDVETDGFYGAYWKCKTDSDCAMIAMIGDDSEDYLARTSVKWLHKLGVNVMTMSPGKKDYGHHNYPLERIEKAINWLKAHGNQKIGIVGASTTGTLALTAASYFEDITLTIGLTPSDFIWQGFMQGKKDGCKEWPIEGESLFSYKGEPLPYMPFCYKHPDYWHVIEKETKRTGDMINSRKLFDDSEKTHPIKEDEMIKIALRNGKEITEALTEDYSVNPEEAANAQIDQEIDSILRNQGLVLDGCQHIIDTIIVQELLKRPQDEVLPKMVEITGNLSSFDLERVIREFNIQVFKNDENLERKLKK